MAERSEQIHIGCQGWNYEDWTTRAGSESVFYPTGTRPAGMLEVYARAFDTVEVDSTFYAVPALSTIEGWAKRTPSGFTFSLKLPQEITHNAGLRIAECAPVFNEFCERARALKEKLAVVLVQLPPHFDLTPENARALHSFVLQLPKDIRFSIEFRAPAWLHNARLLRFLSEHNVAPALVEGEWIARETVWKAISEIQNEFAYIRWMGARDLTRFDAVQRAQDENLRSWVEVIERLLARNQTVFAYFSNFYEGHAPTSANKLKRLLHQTVIASSELENQPSLF
jgi:uncharacterized protein YecE (DUF72 family)